jgi:7,8-dihydroneopterin aldolase/epimerase/oxygenase
MRSFCIIFASKRDNMVTKIELATMKFYAYHGVMPQERVVGNNFIVNLTLTVPIQKALITDDLNDTLNYAAVYEVVKREMNISSNLIEHVAGRIVRALKAEFPQIEAIDLKLSKLNPPIVGEVASASIILSEMFDE